MDSWIVPVWSLKKQGVVQDWTSGSSPRGSFKTRRGSELDSWIVPTCSLKTWRCSGLDSWIVPAWILKNKEVFRIGLVDRPGVLFRIAPHRALKTGRCSKSDRYVLFSYLTQCYYPHTSRVSVSRVWYFNSAWPLGQSESWY